MAGYSMKTNEVSYEKSGSTVTSRSRKYLIVFAFLAFILTVVGIVLIATASSGGDCDGDTGKNTGGGEEDTCAYSDEAKRVDLGGYLDRVRDEYFEAFPNAIAYHPTMAHGEKLKRFKVFEYSVANIKSISDRADKLLEEGRNMKLDSSLLKPREYKGFLQAKHFLEFTFGNADLKYSAGIWLMGPSGFCSSPMCSLASGIHNSVGNRKPKSTSDVDFILKHLTSVKTTVDAYIEVLKQGYKTGMVRTQIECRAGIDAMKESYPKIGLDGEQGVFNESWTQWANVNLTSAMPKNETDKWAADHGGKTVVESVKEAILNDVGKSLARMFSYLEGENYLRCRPNAAGAGGLSALPISVVYNNSKVDPSVKVDPTLPGCSHNKMVNCTLNGAEAYASIVGYYSTKDIHPNKIYELGEQQVKKLYAQALDIAKKVTNKTDDKAAVDAFQLMLKDRSLNYFHIDDLPKNESNAEAHKKCKDEESAKKYCPVRWRTLMKWFEFEQRVFSLLDPKTVPFFYFTGEKHTTPNCPVKLKADFNPSSGAQSYNNPGGAPCNQPAYFYTPFFLELMGPISTRTSINAHEARPGHHTQVQGLEEHFRDTCGGPEGWLDGNTYYTAFTEGWALYAENPLIAQQTDTYESQDVGTQMQKYGMLQWQIWRALRLKVDTGLHYKGKSRQWALEQFRDYAWDETDIAHKEVTRYQSNPGQATAYMIGQLDIWQSRNNTEQQLGDKYHIKDFHLQALSQGSSPLAYLTSHMKRYVACVNDPTKLFCDIILNPTKAKSTKKTETKVVRDESLVWPKRRHYV